MTKKALSSKAHNNALPQLVFTEDFQQDVTGEIKSGSEVTILFNSERLPFDRSSDEKGKSAWSISAFYQFSPGGEVNEINLMSEKADSRKKTKAVSEGGMLKGVLNVPVGGEEIIIWFLNTGNTGNEYYDSDFGKNYRFRVLPDVIETDSADLEPVKKRRAKPA